MRNLLFGLCCALLLCMQQPRLLSYNNLLIPDTLSGRTFNLVLRDTFAQYKTGNQTITSAINGATFWGPTLIFQHGDTVHLNVTNHLNDSTTIHWHGMHLPAVMDGGPHQIIPPGTVWQPYYRVSNKAATYWYHPHLHEMTQEHLTKGLGGFIIVRDSEEAALALPRSYGVDDIPLVFTSRRFDAANQFVTTNIAYGDYLLANGVMNAQCTLPRQVVRLRILNGEIERAYNVGFSDNRTFYVIATDGGLVNTPVAVTRLRLAVGERAEIVVDLSNDAVGASIDLKAFNSGQVFGFPGGEPAQGGPLGSLLNNADFVMLHINVGAEHAPAQHQIPKELAHNTYWTASDATVKKTVNVTDGTPGTNFTLDNKAYGFDRIDKITKLNDVEQWTVTNNQVFGHAFHIHDVQFKLVARNGSASAVGAFESGWKDVAFLPKAENLTFVAKFDDYADSTHPFMYHCHFVNHEDGGMMGQFVVVGPQSVLSVNPSQLFLSSTAGANDSFTVNANQHWSLSVDQKWCTPSISSGNTTALVHVTATENTAADARTAVVTVTGDNGLTQTVKVVQAGVGHYLQLSAASVELSAAGESKDIKVHANTSWTVHVDNPWCVVTPLQGNGDSTLHVSAAANTSGSTRQTTLRVDGVDVQQNTTQVLQSSTTDVRESEAEKVFQLYPNPVGATLFIRSTQAGSELYYVRIHTVNGRCVMMLPRPDGEHGIDISGLAPGSYAVEVTEAPTMKRHQFMLQKQ